MSYVYLPDKGPSEVQRLAGEVGILAKRVAELESALDGYALPALDDAITALGALEARGAWSDEWLTDLRDALEHARAVFDDGRGGS